MKKKSGKRKIARLGGKRLASRPREIPPAAEAERRPQAPEDGMAVAGPGPTDGNGSPVPEEAARP